MDTLGELVRVSRELGARTDFVLHGGGNTSAKGTQIDIFGEEREVLWVKGSGWDLGSIEAEGFPALDLKLLRKLELLDSLGDEEMVQEVRRQMFNDKAPNPSVETLLHAFLPHRFILHSHANAILAVSNQKDGEAYCEQLFGQRLAYLPYVMPGFPLAKAVSKLVRDNPIVDGVLLHQHGLFTFADNADEALNLHREFVEIAANKIKATTTKTKVQRHPNKVEILLSLRGLCGAKQHQVLDIRDSDEMLGMLAREDAKELFCTSPLTPDHALRTKAFPCFVATPDDISSSVADFVSAYQAYFESGCEQHGPKRRLVETPQLVLMPGVGLIGIGQTEKAAQIVADIGEHTLRTKASAQDAKLGKYQGLSQSDLFAMEYWSLEQAKLSKSNQLKLQGQVAVITGGGGAIGEGIAKTLRSAGAVVVLVDVDANKLEEVAARQSCDFVVADVTKEEQMTEAFERVVLKYGGVDIVVPNAGIAHSSAISECESEAFRRLVEVNQTGCFITLKVASKFLKQQGLGGSIVLISSKNVAAPGAHFSAYSSSKAGMHQLGRVAAIELAADKIRVNMVCPDAVFGCAENPSGLWQEVGPSRAKSKGLDPEELEAHYRQRNLLRAAISAEDVGRAVLFFAGQETPTTGASLAVDGGIIGAI